MATGSAGVGSSASMSVTSSTPPPLQTVATASATARCRSGAASAPVSGPSSSTSRRPAHTARTSVALPTPAGPVISTPRFGLAPSFSSSAGSSRASLSHSVSRPACTCWPFRSSMDTGGVCGHTMGGLTSAPWPAGADVGVTPSPQVTDEFGCTLTGPAGSVPVTVSSSEVQVMPTEDASAELASDVDVPGPRSRGSSDTVSPTVITLPSRAWRKVADDTDWVASVDPRSVTDRAPYTVTGDTSTVVSSRRPALDSVTSSSSAVPAGVSGGATPATAAVVREPVSDTASHSRMPRAAMASGCSRTTPRRESVAEVFSRAVSARLEAGGGGRRGSDRSLLSPPAYAGRAGPPTGGWGAWRGGSPAGRHAAGGAWSSHASGRAATQRWLRIVNGMMDDVAGDDQQDHQIGEQQQPGRGADDQHQQDRRGMFGRHRERFQRQHRDAADTSSDELPPATSRRTPVRRPPAVARTAAWRPAGRSRRPRRTARAYRRSTPWCRPGGCRRRAAR